MEKQQWEKINSVIDKALTLPEEQRDSFISKQCKNNPELKAKITELLKSIKKSATESFLEKPDDYPGTLAANIAVETNNPDDNSSLVGQTIGVYHIDELVAHGGMGSVFRAHRADEAYESTVALKVLRRGLDTPSNVARFKRERNILAKLNHPNIARLLDGGMTGEGLPYLVMEYVKGENLIEYCNKHQLSIPGRITLFEDICKAVQHAHHNAVIHRDLKPSNIFVTKDGTVKVLDFGIAKLFEPNDSEKNRFKTRTKARMITPGYAAPEQLNNQPVTTATDTYTLGILLYELLAGLHPFDHQHKSSTEIEAAILKSTPYKPSQNFSRQPKNEQQSLANHRNSTPGEVKNKLQGDLDAIIMKALRKEPDARYHSVEQLWDDLQRRKQNLPIIARKDTFRYKSSKFIKRQKTALAVAAGFLILIASFITFYTWQITKQRNEAQQAEQKARQTLQYLINIFDYADPNQASAQNLTAAQMLDRGTDYIDSEIADQPEVKAALLGTMGSIYKNLGQYQKAGSLLTESLQMNRQLYSEDHLNLANSMYRWAGYKMKTGADSLAKSYFRKSAAMYNRLGNRSKYAATLGELGWAYYLDGKYEKADSLLQKALSINRALHGPNSGEVAWDYQYLGWISNGQGDFQHADSLFRKALTIRTEKFGVHHRLTAQTQQSLARILYNRQQYDEARQYVQAALNTQQDIFDGNHADIASSLNILGLINMREGQYKKAENYFTQVLHMRLDLFGNNHPYVLTTRNNLASVYYFMGNYGKAADMFSQVVNTTKKVRGPFHPEVATSLNNLAKTLQKARHQRAALKHYRQAIEIGRKNYNKEHPTMRRFRHNLALLYEALNQYAEASRLWRQNFEVLRKKNGLTHSQTKKVLTHLINCNRKLGNVKQQNKYQALLVKSNG